MTSAFSTNGLRWKVSARPASPVSPVIEKLGVDKLYGFILKVLKSIQRRCLKLASDFDTQCSAMLPNIHSSGCISTYRHTIKTFKTLRSSNTMATEYRNLIRKESETETETKTKRASPRSLGPLGTPSSSPSSSSWCSGWCRLPALAISGIIFFILVTVYILGIVAVGTIIVQEIHSGWNYAFTREYVKQWATEAVAKTGLAAKQYYDSAADAAASASYIDFRWLTGAFAGPSENANPNPDF